MGGVGGGGFSSINIKQLNNIKDCARSTISNTDQFRGEGGRRVGGDGGNGANDSFGSGGSGGSGGRRRGDDDNNDNDSHDGGGGGGRGAGAGVVPNVAGGNNFGQAFPQGLPAAGGGANNFGQLFPPQADGGGGGGRRGGGGPSAFSSRAPSPIPSLNASMNSDAGSSRNSGRSGGRASLALSPQQQQAPAPPPLLPFPQQQQPPRRQWLSPSVAPPPQTAALLAASGGDGGAQLSPIPMAAPMAAPAAIVGMSPDANATVVMNTPTPPRAAAAAAATETALAEATTAASQTLAALDRALETDISPVLSPRRRRQPRQQQQQQQPDDIAEARDAAEQTLNALTEANVNVAATTADDDASSINPYRRIIPAVRLPVGGRATNVRLQQAIQQPVTTRPILRAPVLQVEATAQQQQIIPTVQLPLGVPQATVQLLQQQQQQQQPPIAAITPHVIPTVRITPPSPPPFVMHVTPPTPLPPEIVATRPILRPSVLGGGNVIPAVRLPLGVAGPRVRLQAIQEQQQQQDQQQLLPPPLPPQPLAIYQPAPQTAIIAPNRRNRRVVRRTVGPLHDHPYARRDRSLDDHTYVRDRSLLKAVASRPQPPPPPPPPAAAPVYQPAKRPQEAAADAGFHGFTNRSRNQSDRRLARAADAAASGFHGFTNRSRNQSDRRLARAATAAASASLPPPEPPQPHRRGRASAAAAAEVAQHVRAYAAVAGPRAPPPPVRRDVTAAAMVAAGGRGVPGAAAIASGSPSVHPRLLDVMGASRNAIIQRGGVRPLASGPRERTTNTSFVPLPATREGRKRDNPPTGREKDRQDNDKKKKK